MDKSVLIWWSALIIITIANVLAWIYSAIIVQRRKAHLSITDYILTRRILILAGVYVVSCGIRAVMPRIDAQRISLFDHWLSSILVGRTIATIAELCFIAQWVLLLQAIGAHRNDVLVTRLSYWLLPLIFIAEIFSWSAVVSTFNFGHVIEESLWVLSAGLVLICFLKLHVNSSKRQKNYFTILMLCTVGYMLFMVSVDIPMYFSRWQADIESNHHTLSFIDGFHDLSNRWVVIRNWKTWRAEVPWMTLYYSVAVWTSIALTHVPSMREFRRVDSD